MIKVSQVYKSYQNSIPALRDISFEIEMGGVVYLLGESGSGKSTLVKIIAGLEDADEGEVRVGDEEITGPAKHLVPGYENIAYVPQDFKLQEYWTVSDNIGKKISHYSPADKDGRIAELLELCQLQDYAERMPRELSGGQKQRIAIAAAIADDPDVVLLDEPFSNLDLPMKIAIRQEIIEILRSLEITVILVSHDPAEALAAADMIILLRDGQIEQMASPVTLYQRPHSHYAAKFLGPVNELKLDGKIILKRPEEIKISENGKFDASVISAPFMGMHYHIFLKTKFSSSPILAYAQQPLKLNQKVRFSID
ncbi:MAG: ABC transporter ATP-binding protein [Reichenbachiella sp.]|uniref:ABC transporter ATP-binding protein n=1 Tax=Reichenbachiella sp. TaxID=2184521 RepID=UPI0032678E55